MKKTVIKRTISFVLLILMLISSASAKDSDIFLINREGLTFHNDMITGETDNSDLEVDVIRCVDDTKTLIYSGTLGGYVNGLWKYVDFSRLRFLVLYNWETYENEAIYIIPSQYTSKSNENIVSADDTALLINSAENSLISYDFAADIAFWNESGYDEYIPADRNILGMDLKIQNLSDESENIQPYLVLYKDSRMVEAKMLIPQSTESGEFAEYSQSFRVPKNESGEYTLKVFNWSNGTLMPLSNTVSVNGNKNDFYGNSIETGTFIHDLSKEINGSLNSASDADFFKIIPESTSTLTVNFFSLTDAETALYDSDGDILKRNFSTLDYTFKSGRTYYLSVSGAEAPSDYVFTLQEQLTDDAKAFNVYKFDEEVNIYKKSIITIYDDLCWLDQTEPSKQMHNEYEKILSDDAQLHSLPDFLEEHPKDTSDFSALINRYYGTKYSAFSEIKQRYISLIDQYTELHNIAIYGESGLDLMDTDSTETDKPSGIVSRRASAPQIQIENSETDTESPDDTIDLMSAPSLTITGTTETSITYNAVFPKSKKRGNTIYMVDFNTENGLTTFENVYGNDERRENGTDTISGLSPGGIYILAMMWSTDGGDTFGYENAIFRFVQLPDSTEENLTLYPGERVAARLEEADKELASDSDFATWLNRMDKVYSAYKELTGYTPYESKKIEMKSTRSNLNDEFDITDGHDYWWVIFGCYDYTNIFKHSRVFSQGHMRRLSQNDWGDTPMHELSHVFDRDRWIFDDETLAQFKLYYAAEQLDARIYRPDRYDNDGRGWYTGENYYDLLKYDRYLDSYTATFEEGYYSSEGFAVILIDIQKEIGWEPFKKTFRYFSDLSWEQIPDSEGEILNLFLTKLKDFSGEDVLNMISARDTEIIAEHFGFDLEYSDPVYPLIYCDGYENGKGITLDEGGAAIFQFIPEESGNYNIYTAPYGGSGTTNDTFIEIYSDSNLENLIASNDDYGNGRFSLVNIAATEDTPYYIKVRNYSSEPLHAELHITKVTPVEELTLDSYVDKRVSYGEYALFAFTPDKSITHVFEVENYNGGTTAYDTYIKLYEDENLTNRIEQHENKIMVNLKAGHTYYLQFSGYLMKSARGRISVREGQTIDFQKRTDSSFIFVNSPEYITRVDIVDDECHEEDINTALIKQKYLKIFEEKNVTGHNTFYETHISWYGENGEEHYEPKDSFYIDVDMYNPTDEPVTVSVENLVYGTEHTLLKKYYTGDGYAEEITIQPGEHRLVVSNMNEPFKCEPPTGWARILDILFDFTVQNGNITLSTIAAYDPDNLYLRNNTENIVDATGAVLDSGEIIHDLSQRPNEDDLHAKIKGIARNEGAWIDAEIEYVIDENTQLGSKLPLYLKDDYYTYGIANPKWSWMSSVSPIHDQTNGLLFALPDSLHNFKYHFGKTEREWNFDFWHRNLKHIEADTNRSSVNDEVSSEVLDHAKQDMAAGERNHFKKKEAPDGDAVGTGEWGTTYHYTVTVKNDTNETRTVCVKTWNGDNVIYGVKKQGESTYETNYSRDIDNPTNTAQIEVSPNETLCFEFVMFQAASECGLNHAIVIE